MFKESDSQKMTRGPFNKFHGIISVVSGLQDQFNNKIVKIESWLLFIDLFEMFAQAIKFYKFHYLILKRRDV